jgi:hypothetical protein
MIYTVYINLPGGYIMANVSVNYKLDEEMVSELKEASEVYNRSVTDLVKEALSIYLEDLKNDPFYRLTVFAKEASQSESDEIISEIEKLSDDDLKIAKVKKFEY